MSMQLPSISSDTQLGFQMSAYVDQEKKDPSYHDYEEIISPVDIRRTNIFDWTELTPFSEEKATGHFFVELVTKKEADAIDMSSWIRLINDKGQIISVGLDQSTFHNERQVRLVSPVYNEFITGNECTTRFNITKEQFKALKTKIEADQKGGIKKNNAPIYTIFSSKNSLTYATDLLSEIGIEVKNKELVIISWGRKALNYFKMDMPECIEKIALAAMDFFKSIGSAVSNLALMTYLTTLFPILKILSLPIFQIKREDCESPSIHKTLQFQENIQLQRDNVSKKFKAQTNKHRDRIVALFNKEMNLNLTKRKELTAFIKNASEKDLKTIEDVIENA